MFRLDTTDTSQAPPLIIETRYTPSDQIDEPRLTLVYYDALAKKWLPLKTAIDAINHVATAEALAQDTVYALVVSLEAASLPPNAVIVDDLDTAHFARYGAVAGWHGVSGSNDHYY